MTFRDFNLDEQLLEGLDAMGFETPTPVQEKTIPHILNKKDLIGCAQTGTGKTAAFLLPVINQIIQTPERTKVQGLVIAPTRELAQQIDQQVEGLGYFTGVSSFPVYGGGDGSSYEQERKAFESGTDIIIATPGRLFSHMNFEYADFSELKYLILDEADRMLDMGFYDDIMRIIKRLPENRQTLLFSATMPDKIRTLAKQILTEPESINIAISKPASGLMQGAYVVYDKQKIPVIESLLVGKDLERVIIFSSTKSKVGNIVRALRKRGLKVAGISSDLEQNEREETLLKFKSKETRILVATDILSRGIDIKEISLVINYNVPNDAEDYVHRVGRTARADKTGVAITLIDPEDQNRFHRIEQLIETEVKKLPIPTELGEGPVYSPRKGGGKKKRHFGKKGKGGGNFRGKKNHKGKGGKKHYGNKKQNS